MKNLFLLLAIAAMVLASCRRGKNENEPKDVSLTQETKDKIFTHEKQIFGALPDQMPGSENDTPEMIELGKKLYFETRLSVNGTQFCNTCHDITNGNAGVDNKPVSPGAIGGKFGTRNSNTVLNSGSQFAQFWDGRSADFKEQAKGPILNPAEMAMPSEKEVGKVILDAVGYSELFAKAYPKATDPITYDNIANSIAAFERTLVSKSRYEDYITGHATALNNAEINGLKTFMDEGCTTCHNGPLFGGNMYQRMGLFKMHPGVKDFGRFDVTKTEQGK